MQKNNGVELSGFVTMQQLADYLHMSHTTLRKKLVPLRPFLNFEKRKRLYSPDEWSFVILHVNATPQKDLTQPNES
jgi:hypothetical protein